MLHFYQGGCGQPRFAAVNTFRTQQLLLGSWSWGRGHSPHYTLWPLAGSGLTVSSLGSAREITHLESQGTIFPNCLLSFCC